jgi:hypothetical protein
MASTLRDHDPVMELFRFRAVPPWSKHERDARKKGEIAMKKIALSLLLSSFAFAPALADSCKNEASAKKLAGAALSSFMTKCQKDAQASCDTAAGDKKLSGAAKTSFTNKCLNDAVGN